MLKIRAEHMIAFQESAYLNFRLMVMKHLRAEMPEAVEGQTDEAIMADIAKAVNSAQSFGIAEPVPLAQYVCLSFATGDRLDADPDLIAYLERIDIDQETKMQALVDELEGI